MVLIVGVLIFAGLFYFIWSKLKPAVKVATPPETASSSEKIEVRLEGASSTAVVDANKNNKDRVEYLAFSDFYQEPSGEGRVVNFSDLSLPMNIKIDVVNYFDISRKLDLEPALADLNNNSFAVLNNPWPKDAGNFYALAAKLDDKQIPLFISSDFISYYYQNTLKTAFKEIEESVFYESLWKISSELYEKAKSRYEARLAEIGNINDRVLEGERLEAAFFAVSLELLKPQVNQVDIENQFNASKFSISEQKKFNFSVPDYLSDDVLKELALIRLSKDKKKSPVLLYDRDYKAFLVPADYKNNARLQNFYLAAVWLNSTFPLNYRDDSCPECLLDQDDWRVNFTAACLIAQDFSQNEGLKSEWARVYKTISFFKGLRDSWNYVHYQDALRKNFGDDYNIAVLFAEDSDQADDNMEKLRQFLAAREILPMQGGLDATSINGIKLAGLQFLADFYWPNDFIFSSLRYPQVGLYQGATKLEKSNVTACSINKQYQRCQGSGQDVLSLIYPSWQGSVFMENSNYENYFDSLSRLRELAQVAMKDNLNNYWSSLSLWRYYLNTSEENLPAYWRSESWRERMTVSALGAWTDMQLPLDNLNLKNKTEARSELSMANVDIYSWVEPNLDFFDRILAHNKMVLGMFSALGISERSSLSAGYLQEADRQLTALQSIAVKETKGETLNSADIQIIRDFARMYQSNANSSKTLSWRNAALKATIKESLGTPNLLIIAHPVNDKIGFAIGPVFNHTESR